MPYVREMSHPPQQRSTPPPPTAKNRAPKIQQQSWDDCGKPSIRLYDPSSVVVHHPSLPALPPRSPTVRTAGAALFADSPLAQPNASKSPSRHANAAGQQYYETRSPKSPRKFTYDAAPRSPHHDYDGAHEMGVASTSAAAYGASAIMLQQQAQPPPRSPKITYSNGDGSDFYEMASYASSSGGTYETAQRSPKAAKKFVFDAVSPRSEHQSGSSPHHSQQQVTQFYSYDGNDADNDDDADAEPSITPTFQFCAATRTSRKSHSAAHSSSRNAQQRSADYAQSPPSAEGGPAQQHQPTTFATSATAAASDGVAPDDGRTRQARPSIVATESGYSEFSTATTMTTATATGGGGHRNAAQLHNNSHGGSSGNIGMSVGDSPSAIESPGPDERTMRGRGRRRHAINITSNPGYQQVLHTSHTTLDRTCSDSIVSLRHKHQHCRKSTSDLNATAAEEDPTALPTANRTASSQAVDGGASGTATPVGHQHRRRGSSKGGLAYLASRRNSRESMKSAVSNASIFSNEDIGPLAFQASARGRQRRTSNFLELPIPDHIRPRVCSLPERPYNPRQSDDLYRLRTFSISKGTVVNCGDSIISRRSRSNTSVNSTNSRASERSPFDGSCCGGGYTNVDSLPTSPTNDDSMDEPEPSPRYRVVMMGDAGVGKTALVSQFMTSEYMHTYDASLDDEFGEKTVSILLDGEESEMIFIDHPSTEMSVENSLSTYEPHGCVVVYSVVQRSSFRQAEETINYLWRENVTRDKTVILVGNKADLARSRVIPTTEGKSLAQSRDSKFIETSSGIQHNVDELLVGILKQIRLKETRDKKAAAAAAGPSGKMRNSRTHMSLHLAKEILQKICLSDISKSKSCENLHVL